MSRKHNTRHDSRSRSHYPQRLKRRGLTNVDVRMDDLPTLRRRAARRIHPGGSGLDPMLTTEFDIDHDQFWDDIEATA